MKGTSVNRILSSAVKVAGSLAVAGGALVAAAMPAGAAPPPTRAFGLSANGFIHISPVAEANYFFTPATAASFTSPSFVTTGGILDRASATDAYSNVGSPKVYLNGNITDQFNASNVMSSCRTILGTKVGFTTIQAGSISEIGLPNIPLPRNPGINTKIVLPGVTITLNRQSTFLGVRTVTAAYFHGFGQNLSIGVTRC
jgi:hypothetical protein